MVDSERSIDTNESRALIVGLGNPGAEYAGHRHNVGFRVVEALARAHGLSFSRRRRARAYVAEGQIGGRAVALVKPHTFMNLSGRAVSRLSRQDGIPPEHIMVAYDDLDLPLGRLRLRPEGGAGGHKGMRSIINLLGTQAFPRLRIGIERPPGRMDPADYVLQSFDKEQEPLVREIVEAAVACIECWLADGIVAAMDRFNQPLPLGTVGGEPSGQTGIAPFEAPASGPASEVSEATDGLKDSSSTGNGSASGSPSAGRDTGEACG